MKVSTQVLVCLTCLLASLIPGTVQAQVEGTRAPVLHNQVISANPFLLLGEWFNAEYERKIAPTATVGVIGSRVSFDDGDAVYTSLNGFFRYYPQGAALSGFYMGGRLGVHQGSVDDGYEDDEGHTYGLGVDIGYSWLLGESRTFYIGLGIGASRLFGGDLDDGRVVIPSIRLINVGFAF